MQNVVINICRPSSRSSFDELRSIWCFQDCRVGFRERSLKYLPCPQLGPSFGKTVLRNGFLFAVSAKILRPTGFNLPVNQPLAACTRLLFGRFGAETLSPPTSSFVVLVPLTRYIYIRGGAFVFLARNLKCRWVPRLRSATTFSLSRHPAN